MKYLRAINHFWEVKYEIGNDWGEPSTIETREFQEKEDVLAFAKCVDRDYYEKLISIREYTEYEFTD